MCVRIDIKLNIMNDKSNLNLAFSTPIWASLLPDYKGLNEIMFKYIKNLQSKNR